MSANTHASDSAYPSPTPNAAPWWRNEDWMAVLAALPVLILATKGIFPSELMLPVWFLVISGLALLASLGKRIVPFVFGAVVIYVLGWASQWIAAQPAVKAYGLEYVIFALGIGLVWSHTLPVPEWLREAVRTEFFIKVGIVLLGATIFLQEMLKAGMPGLIQAALVIPVVWYACYFIAKKLKVDEEFGVMLSTAVSICGVSAAIAACGAIQGDRKKLSYVTSIVLLCAVPMMIVMPVAIKSMGLSEAVGGAWLGGTLDTSGSVAAATEQVGKDATKVGVIVKLSQNVLIGVAAFILSVWWSMRGGANGERRKVSVKVIWERFPKFVLGFVLASVIFSYLVPIEVAAAASKPLKAVREAWFAAAFVCIGLETRLGELFSLGGGRPALAFLGGQVFNIAWTLVLALWLFGK
ncbi:MAG: putative sulfate exporter family transporter [Prosthecobacter sp.]|uniref:YeiH family protein n=1 Tax=Prosthecobacter sp. TaxID=1965333 RepID=UPI0019E9415F|nr:putative sulfate exporter family transporter [Prosthecobacter sp.]MBE2283473.1 putative sulfate exporter family transporter [Prosthecobacter sp.]